LHGVSPGDFDGKVESFSALIHPDDREFVRERIEQALTGEVPYEIEFRVPISDGTTKWLYTNAVVLRDPAGAPYRMIGATVDITERKLSELELARAADIVRYSQDAIIGKDLNGIITTWNRGAERIFGYTPEEIVGKSVTILIPPDRSDEETEILERLRRGEYIDHYETVRQRRDGTLLDISLSVSPLADSSGARP
jgi:PAS domain S-box-containing protein